jgi:hypothetical protein
MSGGRGIRGLPVSEGSGRLFHGLERWRALGQGATGRGEGSLMLVLIHVGELALDVEKDLLAHSQ